MPEFRDAALLPVGFARYTNLNAIRKLDDTPADGIARPTNARAALLQCETQNVRWVDDGLFTLTAAKGMLLIAAQPPLFYTGDLAAIRFLEAVASAGAVLLVSYYR